MVLPIKMQIPDSFYEEEERCGHIITVREKKIWAIELDLLNEFKRVCDKYNLKWYIAYGSLLGTIRHKGFIPWDNDVDVWMPREDFDILCDHVSEFVHPYFLQTPVTENGKYFSFYAKLCNSLTTGSWEGFYKIGLNCGMSLDIFILDDIPDSQDLERKMVNKMSNLCHFSDFVTGFRKISMCPSVKNAKTIVRWLIWKIKYKGCDGAVLFNKINTISRSTLGKGYKRIAVFLSFEKERDRTPKECWEDILWMDFEMLKVPVPIGYDTILKARYGNYMELPKLEERKTHDYLDINPEIPYKKYWGNK